MKDWKTLADAADLDIPAPDVDRIHGPLSALEAAFRPLVKDLTHEIEPAISFSQPEDNE
jgi:hypothetical protein